MNNTDQLNALTSMGVFNQSPTNLNQFLAVAGGVSVIFVCFLIWSIIWKAIALWYAARRGEKGWYIALMILNTLGILEIIYIFAVAKRSDTPASKPIEVAKLTRRT